MVIERLIVQREEIKEVILRVQSDLRYRIARSIRFIGAVHNDECLRCASFEWIEVSNDCIDRGAPIFYIRIILGFVILIGSSVIIERYVLSIHIAAIASAPRAEQICPQRIRSAIIGKHIVSGIIFIGDDAIRRFAFRCIIVLHIALLIPFCQRGHLGRRRIQFIQVGDIAIRVIFDFNTVDFDGFAIGVRFNLVARIAIEELQFLAVDLIVHHINQPIGADDLQQGFIAVAFLHGQIAVVQIEDDALRQGDGVFGCIILVIRQAEIDSIFNDADHFAVFIDIEPCAIGQMVHGNTGERILGFEIVFQLAAIFDDDILRQALPSIGDIFTRSGHGHDHRFGAILLIDAHAFFKLHIHMARRLNMFEIRVGLEGSIAGFEIIPVAADHFHPHRREGEICIPRRIHIHRSGLFEIGHGFIGMGYQPSGEAVVFAFAHIVCAQDQQIVRPDGSRVAAAGNIDDFCNAGEIAGQRLFICANAHPNEVHIAARIGNQPVHLHAASAAVGHADFRLGDIVILNGVGCAALQGHSGIDVVIVLHGHAADFHIIIGAIDDPDIGNEFLIVNLVCSAGDVHGQIARLVIGNGAEYNLAICGFRCKADRPDALFILQANLTDLGFAILFVYVNHNARRCIADI